jgi:hypothetical protein
MVRFWNIGMPAVYRVGPQDLSLVMEASLTQKQPSTSNSSLTVVPFLWRSPMK